MVNSVAGTRHRPRQPKWPGPGPNLGGSLVRCAQSGVGLTTARAWPAGGKIGFR